MTLFLGHSFWSYFRRKNWKNECCNFPLKSCFTKNYMQLFYNLIFQKNLWNWSLQLSLKLFPQKHSSIKVMQLDILEFYLTGKFNNETCFDIKFVTLSYESNFCQSIKVQNSNIHVLGLQLTCLVKVTMIIFYPY